MSAESRVIHQKLDQMTALLLFGLGFGVKLHSLEETDTPRAITREEYYVICGWSLETYHFF